MFFYFFLVFFFSGFVFTVQKHFCGPHLNSIRYMCNILISAIIGSVFFNPKTFFFCNRPSPCTKPLTLIICACGGAPRPAADPLQPLICFPWPDFPHLLSFPIAVCDSSCIRGKPQGSARPPPQARSVSRMVRVDCWHGPSPNECRLQYIACHSTF